MNEQQRVGSVSPEGQRACVVCSAPVIDARCDECGVAVAPGGWRIIRQLAKGPHSRVFLAEKDGRQVALKELLFALVPEAAQLDGFEREARLLAQLKHPAIPRLVEFFKEGQGVHTRLYLAQEFVRGKSLLSQLEDHRFDEREAKALARELLAVLEYLHGLSPRVIHRDIKPANIMRRDDGSLAVVDFGAARDLVRGVTHGATLVGTFGYMPPEQLGGTVDLTSDLYAVGATLLHLLSRRPPDELFKPGMELAFEHEINVSPEFREWLSKLVQRDRTARFQSAREALEALDRKKVQPRTAPVNPRARAGTIATVAGITVVAMLTSIGLLVATPSRVVPPPPPPVKVQPVKPVVTPVAPVKPAPALPKPSPVQAVPKAKALAPFTLDAPFTVSLGDQLTLASADAAGAACPTPSTLAVKSIGAQPDKLVLGSELKNNGGPPGCANVFVELMDQTGTRASATLLSGSSAGTTSLNLPANSRSVQLRLGPQAKPFAIYDVDLAGHKVVRR